MVLPVVRKAGPMLALVRPVSLLPLLLLQLLPAASRFACVPRRLDPGPPTKGANKYEELQREEWQRGTFFTRKLMAA